jgi:hypothetical protein
MHGIGLDVDVRTWFDVPTAAGGRATSRRRAQRRGHSSVPAPKVPRDLIARALLA